LALVILSEAKNLDFKTLRFAQLTTKNQFPKKSIVAICVFMRLS